MKGPAPATRLGKTAARDPERTRERILSAALDEFSAKGFAGARVDVIARRARINKRMLYHYFGDKTGLFRQVLRRKMAQRAAWAASSPDDPAESLPYWFERALQDIDWIRLQQWEALQVGRGTVIDEKARRKAAIAGVENIRSRQQRGFIDAGLDARHVLLAMVSLTSYALAFPQVARLITGLSPNDPRFRIERTRFLRWMGAALRPSNRPEHRPSLEAIGSGERQVA
ncbi:MAG TPA: TetR/AcrR family transcriptional regulator [Haliangiales bacterium]|nr:TetR/AcrR family transcriptional regulator [Haliangiales bacterium]